ncbi:hypothetical protein ACH5RR_036012 [Cinchona calisaya]|uniref:Pentatricopeptide repeat-containing protein n=1 Tax=Cinchona calisaya TaxID=153742 RepID=A0ABD2Y371_9GENT
MKLKDEVFWTALVSGYAQFVKANATIYLFEEMLAHGLQPDAVTFIALLSACSRAASVEERRRYFKSMNRKMGNEIPSGARSGKPFQLCLALKKGNVLVGVSGDVFHNTWRLGAVAEDYFNLQMHNGSG